jgi:hypothetical protein
MGRNIFGWDYPPGAEGDPNAPWNQRPDETQDCEDCDGKGYIFDIELNENVECKFCRGLGYIEIDCEDI